MKAFLVVITVLSAFLTQNALSYEGEGSRSLIPDGAIYYNDGGGYVYLVYSKDKKTVTVLDTQGNLIGTVKNKQIPALSESIRSVKSEAEVKKEIQKNKKQRLNRDGCPEGFYRDIEAKRCIMIMK